MEKDITTNDLLSNPDIFADIANVNVFHGKRMICTEDLEAVPLESSYKDLDGKHHRLFRDTLMKVKNLGGCIAFMGYESQTDINRAIPVRDMGYAYTCYAKQIREIVAKNNAEKNSAYTKVLHEHQKLMPVATFILYFGEEEWTSPLSLMDILDIPEEDKGIWEEMILDYPIHVIPMLGQPEAVRKQYCSDYGVIADYLAYYKDKELVDRHLSRDNRKLVHVEQVLDMLEAFSGDTRFEQIKQHYSELEDKEECDTMCLLLDACEERGIEKGMERGMQRGMQQGIERGIHLTKSVLRLDGEGYAVSDIATELQISVEKVKRILEE